VSAGPIDRAPLRGASCGIAAAALFGASAPVAKLLLPDARPLVLAALLYAGAAVALTVGRALRAHRRGAASAGASAAEPRLRAADVPLLGVVAVSGGVIGPVLMLLGLERVSGIAGSLLLNLEAPFTMLVAVVLFREHVDRRGIAAAALIVGGGLALAWSAGDLSADPLGALALAGACLAWAVDNNLTQRLSLRDPVAIVQLKAGGAALGNALLAAGVDASARIPDGRVVVAALVLGALSYGASILLDVYALRLVGAAREAAYFATAPFFGALLAVPLLGERIGARETIAAALMVAGVRLLLHERHEHRHRHEPLVHEHLHTHDDEHHRHAHDTAVAAGVSHSHEHAHDALEHSHPHVPDAHHRHGH
jgi:drug/metabolite transporter (DMT)-like permease